MASIRVSRNQALARVSVARLYRALKPRHQLQQRRGCRRTLRLQLEAKPFTDFLAERKHMQAADLTVALARGMRHHVSDRFEIHPGRAKA